MDIRVMQYFVTVAKEESYEKKNEQNKFHHFQM